MQLTKMQKVSIPGLFMSALLLLCLWESHLHAQERAYRHIDRKDGLPSSNVYWVMQDHLGYLWFATDKGIARYNGREFTTYTTGQGLPDNEVFRIHEDFRGRKWLLTLNGQAGYVYQGKAYNPENTPWLSEISGKGFLLGFVEDAQHNLWFSYSLDSRIIVVDTLDHVRKKDYDIKIMGRIDLLFPEPRSGNIHGVAPVHIWDLEKGQKKVSYPAETYFFYKKGFVDPEGTLFFANNDNVYRYRDSMEVILPPGQLREIIALEQTGKDSFWIGTEKNGVFRLGLEGDRLKIREHLLPGKKVTHIFKDNHQNLWFTTVGAGVYCLTTHKIQSFGTEQGLADAEISALGFDPSGKLWLGHIQGKVSRLERGGFVAYDLAGNLARSKTLFIKTIADSMLVLGRDDRLNFFKNGKPVQSIPLKSRAFAALDNGRDYLVSNSMVFRIDKDSLPYIKVSFDPPLHEVFAGRVQALYKHSNGRVYIGSDHGLKVTDGFEVWDSPWEHPVLNKTVTDIREGLNGDLWVTTYGWGCLLIRKDSVFVFNTSNGLAGDICEQVFVDEEGIVWVASNNGLNMLRPGPGNAYSIETFSTEDGLLYPEITAVVRKNDSVWIGTPYGLNLLLLQKNRKSGPPPKILLQGFWVGDSSYLYKEQRRFSPRQNRVRVHFDGLSLAGFRSLSYEYQLKGLSDAIQRTPNNEVEFSSLSPGNYTFSVWAVGPHGQRSPEPAQVQFVIESPWWWNGWILALMALILLLLVLGAIRYFKLRADRRAALRIRMAEAEQMALRSQMNPHFIFNALNSIQRYIIRKDTQSAYSYLESFGRLIRMILENSRKSKISVEEEIEWIRLYLELEAMRFESAFSYEIKTDPDLETTQLYIPTMLIQPIVENAIWHGIMPKEVVEGSWVNIYLKKRGAYLVCIVEDNGIGMAQSQKLKEESKFKKRSLGLNLTRDRLHLLNSSNDQEVLMQTEDLHPGTRVTLKIPLLTHSSPT